MAACGKGVKALWDLARAPLLLHRAWPWVRSGNVPCPAAGAAGGDRSWWGGHKGLQWQGWGWPGSSCSLVILASKPAAGPLGSLGQLQPSSSSFCSSSCSPLCPQQPRGWRGEGVAALTRALPCWGAGEGIGIRRRCWKPQHLTWQRGVEELPGLVGMALGTAAGCWAGSGRLGSASPGGAWDDRGARLSSADVPWLSSTSPLPAALGLSSGDAAVLGARAIWVSVCRRGREGPQRDMWWLHEWPEAGAGEWQLCGRSGSSGHLCAHAEHLPSQQLLKETPASLSSDPVHVARASPGSCALAAPGPPPAPRPVPFPEGTLVPGAAPCITRIDGAGSMAPAGDQKAPEGSWSEGWLLWQSPPCPRVGADPPAPQ